MKNEERKTTLTLILVPCSNLPPKARFLLLTDRRNDATIKVTTNEKTNQPFPSTPQRPSRFWQERPNLTLQKQKPSTSKQENRAL
ncbi:hypothetical protein, partial [Pedobacter sp. UBA4863]